MTGTGTGLATAPLIYISWPFRSAFPRNIGIIVDIYQYAIYEQILLRMVSLLCLSSRELSLLSLRETWGIGLTLYSAQRQNLAARTWRARTRQRPSADSRRSCRLTLRSPPAQSCISPGSSCRWSWGSQRSGPVVCQQSSAARKGSPEGGGSTGNTVGPQLMSILWIWSVGQLCFTECSVNLRRIKCAWNSF